MNDMLKDLTPIEGDLMHLYANNLDYTYQRITATLQPYSQLLDNSNVVQRFSLFRQDAFANIKITGKFTDVYLVGDGKILLKEQNNFIEDAIASQHSYNIFPQFCFKNPFPMVNIPYSVVELHVVTSSVNNVIKVECDTIYLCDRIRKDLINIPIVRPELLISWNLFSRGCISKEGAIEYAVKPGNVHFIQNSASSNVFSFSHAFDRLRNIHITTTNENDAIFISANAVNLHKAVKQYTEADIQENSNIDYTYIFHKLEDKDFPCNALKYTELALQYTTQPTDIKFIVSYEPMQKNGEIADLAWSNGIINFKKDYNNLIKKNTEEIIQQC